MSVRSTAADLRRRIPFGIGTVVAVLCVGMVAIFGVVLAMGTPETSTDGYANGQLRTYTHDPKLAWTQSSDTLPGYGDGTDITVADTAGDRWLLAYPSGLGRAYVMVSRQSGEMLWNAPVVVGLGSCAFNDDDAVGCAIKLGGQPDAFYGVADDGTATRIGALDDTAAVVGVGTNYLRIDQAGYRVSMKTPADDERWTRTFAAAATGQSVNGLLIVSTADGNEFVVDPSTGEDQLTCAQCKIVSYPSGIAVQYQGSRDEKVVTYAVTDGRLRPRPVSQQAGLRIVDGASTLPVLTATGSSAVQETQGRYEIRDPAVPRALWQITDAELSKANTRPCGELVTFALKDRSRVIYRLDDGSEVGKLAVTPYDDPDSNIDQLRCVGSSGSTIVFANHNQITAVDAASGSVTWRHSVIGQTSNVDGYIVVTQGSSLSVLRPG